MNLSIYDDIPGVGEVAIYRKNTISGENNLWLDNLAFKILEKGSALSYEEFEEVCGEINTLKMWEMPFIETSECKISFCSEKYSIATILISVYEALLEKNDLVKLTSLMPYDNISYFRPVIEPEDYELITAAIDSSQNDHYKRFLLLLLRRCAAQKDKWGNWLKEYIGHFSHHISSYPQYTVHRDAYVTYASIRGKEVLYVFVDRIMQDEQLKQYEKRHFLESFGGSSRRAGDVLYWKIIESGYRQEIAPINIYALHFFPSEKNKLLLMELSKEHKVEAVRLIAKKSLELCG